MTESEQLAAFAAAVRDSTLKRLRRVPAGWESWRPATGTMSIAEVAGQRRCDLLLSFTPESLQGRIRDDRFGGEVSAWWVIVRGNLDHEIHHCGQIASGLAQIRTRTLPTSSTSLRGISNCMVHPDGLAAAGQPTEQQIRVIAAAGIEEALA